MFDFEVPFPRNGEANKFESNLYISGLLGFWVLSIVPYFEKHKVSETGSVSFLKGDGGRHLLFSIS
jgi:hypothetical protein